LKKYGVKSPTTSRFKEPTITSEEAEAQAVRARLVKEKREVAFNKTYLKATPRSPGLRGNSPISLQLNTSN
jgi:hypothetical protein